MNKKVKIITSIGTLLTVASATAVAVSYGTKENRDGFYIAGRYFNSPEEALQHLIESKLISTGNTKVLGDIKRSFKNEETGELNKNFLPDFSPRHTHFAYFNVDGQSITKNYEEAKATYFSPTSINRNYMDGFSNKRYSNAQAAKNAMLNNVIVNNLGYYDVEYVKNDKTYGKRKINPMNVDDINSYKQNLQDNMRNILLNYIFESDPKKKHGYSIKVENPTSTAARLDLSNIISSYVNEMKTPNGSQLYTTSGNRITYIKPRATFSRHMKPHGWISVASRFASVGNRGNYVGNYWTTRDYNMIYANNQFRWIGRKEISNVTAIDFKRILHGSSDGQIISDSNAVLPNSFVKENVIDYINKSLSNYSAEKPLINGFKTNNPIDSELNKTIFNNILSKKSLLSKDAIDTRYDVTLPDFKVKTKWTGGWNHTNYTEIVDGTYNFKYITKETYDISKYKNIDISDSIPADITPAVRTQKKYLLNSLVDLTTSGKKITISRNGLDLFTTTIKMNNKGEIVSDPLKIAETNNIHSTQPIQSFENMSDLDIKNTINSMNRNEVETYVKTLLTNLKNELDSAKDEREIKIIFDKYFYDKDLPFNDPDTPDPTRDGLYTVAIKNNHLVAFDSQLKSDEKIIEQNKIIKSYMHAINKVYHKYGDSNYKLSRIPKHIIKSSDVFRYKNDYLHNNSTPFAQTLAKYKMMSLDDFNPTVWSGIYSDDSFLATTSTMLPNLDNLNLNPSEILTYYDRNNHLVVPGGWQHDSVELLKYNINAQTSPTRDYEHVYVDGVNGPVENIITNIYTLDLTKLGDGVRYFKKQEDLKQYMIKYIQKNSTEV